LNKIWNLSFTLRAYVWEIVQNHYFIRFLLNNFHYRTNLIAVFFWENLYFVKKNLEYSEFQIFEFPYNFRLRMEKIFFKWFSSYNKSDVNFMEIFWVSNRCMKSRPILVNCANSKFKYSVLVTLQFCQYGAFWLLIECVHQFTLSYTLHVSDKIGDAMLHGISIKVKDTELH
jgi:hypothetical protein